MWEPRLIDDEPHGEFGSMVMVEVGGAMPRLLRGPNGIGKVREADALQIKLGCMPLGCRIKLSEIHLLWRGRPVGRDHLQHPVSGGPGDTLNFNYRVGVNLRGISDTTLLKLAAMREAHDAQADWDAGLVPTYYESRKIWRRWRMPVGWKGHFGPPLRRRRRWRAPPIDDPGVLADWLEEHGGAEPGSPILECLRGPGPHEWATAEATA